MIAIHTKSGSFVPEWLSYCHENNVPYREVDCFSHDIINQLEGCDALLWHWPHHDYHAQLFARQLIFSIEKMNVLIFPNSATCWHYNDKVGQKYLLEAIKAPLVPTYVFYSKKEALNWTKQTVFPKVWKLRGGAGSQNVELVKSANVARKIISRSFAAGWSNSRLHPLKERLWDFRRDRSARSLLNISRGMARFIFPRKSDLQREYVYFQDFIPDNDCDIRIVVIGDRSFAIKRVVREGDFRASGSGKLVYDPTQIPIECVSIAFDITASIESQSCAFDFVRLRKKWFVIEISYAFTADAYEKCPGYWDSSLNWHAAPVTPERFIIEDILTQLKQRKS